MPPMLGGFPLRRALTALISSMSMIVLTVASIPTATPSAAAGTTVATAVSPTAVKRTVTVSSKSIAYTDRKNKQATYRNRSTSKVQRGRYDTYLTFPAVKLASSARVTKVTLRVKLRSASHAGQGKLQVRAVRKGWSASSLSYASRPSVSTRLAKTSINKKRGTLTVTLKTSATASRLASGLSLRLSRSSSKYTVKLAKKATLKVYTSSSATAGTKLSITNKPVFAHYFPPYPVSLDNASPSRDYYATQYLRPTGEGSKFAWCGGLLRDRPLGRSSISGDYQLADMRTEVREAKAAGLDGFAVDILTTNTSDRNWYLIEKLLRAAAAEGNFSIMLQPDMWAMGSISSGTFASAMARLAKYSATYRVGGRVIVSPFNAEAKSPEWYRTALSKMKSSYGVSATLLPVFLDASKMSSYASVSGGFGNWGIRNTAAAASWTNWAAKAHALGKLWMEPVSVQDVRPNQQIYDEASNTATLAATWNRAISQKADLVLLPTWNDYSESTSFAPSSDHGWAFLDLNQYYLTKFKTGSYRVNVDEVIISHRIQKTSTPVSYSSTMRLRGGSTSPSNKVEVVTLLTSAASVTVTIGGKTYSYQAPAGKYSQSYSLAEGTFTATVKRAGSTVTGVTTKDAVSFATTAQQDLSYHAVTSRDR
ncbi:MAG TPA: glycoside hydrolase family 71 protein [Propionicimonas sp.]|nr:glycoside hydrolase family 71 protein [Propionicimonas sp.]